MTILDLSANIARSRAGGGFLRRQVLLFTADALAVASVATTVSSRTAVLYGLFALSLLVGRGCYATRFSGLTSRSLGRAAVALGAPALALGAVLDARDAQLLLRSLPLAFLCLVVLRVVALRATSVIDGRSATGQPTLIIGAGSTGVHIAHHLLEHPEHGLQPVGFLDRIDDASLPLPIVGDSRDLATLASRMGIQQVIVAYGQVPEAEMVGIMRACHSLDVDVWVVPRFFELGLTGPRAVEDNLWGLPLTKAPRVALRTYQWRLKRVFDIVVSGFALLVLAPLLGIIAVAVKLSSPGPIFFRQQRVGQGGRTVEVLKFRTLRVNDDSNTTWNVTSDERVTSIGRILRPTSIDEMPQLLNVLRGDMSLVGPRPERPFFVAEFSTSIARYADRHRVPVGVTGLAQVNGLRGDTSIEDRARFDNAYIENWSLWGDIVILFRTVLTVIRPPRAVRISDAQLPVIDLTTPPEAVAPVLDLTAPVAEATDRQRVS